MFPARISVMTFNIWGNNLWPDRKEAVSALLSTFQADVLLLQEVTPDVLQFLDSELMGYTRIHKPADEVDSSPWDWESNIYYNSALFECCASGLESLHIDDYPLRGVFWVRLRLIPMPCIVFLASTAHFPWKGCPQELATGMDQRMVTAKKAVDVLDHISPNRKELAVFAGDFNADYHPVRILSSHGFHEVFKLLKVTPTHTHPVRPSAAREEIHPNRTIDWITIRTPTAGTEEKGTPAVGTEKGEAGGIPTAASLRYKARVMSAMVHEGRGGFPPPSDHKPVITIIELLSIA